MMFPDNNYKIPCPKFFMLNLTKQNGQHAYLYCLKFSENYQINEENNNNIEVPIVIFIRSEKEDLECFKQLLNIINYIIINDDLVENNENNININNYKKVQLLNIFYFLISLLKAPPHSLVKLKILSRSSGKAMIIKTIIITNPKTKMNHIIILHLMDLVLNQILMLYNL